MTIINTYTKTGADYHQGNRVLFFPVKPKKQGLDFIYNPLEKYSGKYLFGSIVLVTIIYITLNM